MLRKLREFILRLRRDCAGAVGIVAAVALPAVIGVSSLVGEYGYVLLVKTENQRVADAAAYAGAIAYNASGTSTAMTNAADAVASLNGVASSNVSASLVNSPTGDGNQAVQVQITTDVPVYLAQVVGAKTTVPVAATSSAELNAKSSPCVLALSGSGGGVTLSGGTSINTSQCTVGSNTNIAVPCGTSITTISAAYSGSVSEPCTGIKTSAGAAAPLAKRSSADPLAGTSQVKAAYSGLSAASGLMGPFGPQVPTGGDIDFGYDPSQTLPQIAADGCSGSFNNSSNVWTVTCGSGTRNFGAISLHGGITVNFALGDPSTNTYTFSGLVDNGGSALNFGPGAYQLAQGLMTEGGSSTTFAGGSFWFGMSNKNCASGGNYSICHKGSSLTFGGPSTFVIGSGVYNGGGGSLSFGSGTANSFQVGPSTDGYALNMQGGADTILADATGVSSLFQVKGEIYSSGGGCTVLSAASEHDINGSMDMSGALLLGSGPYYVTGYVSIGGNGGGNATCAGSTFGVQGTNVTLVIGGSTVPKNGGCQSEAFCITAGYSTVNLTGPSSGSLAGLAVVGPQSNSNGALFTAGASNTTLSGALYFPNGPIAMSGGAGLGGGTGQCLEIIGSEVSMSGGAAAASNCQALSSSNAGSSILLVQ
jgi:Flp pilus assembly protein TadG